jgi:hypothetical protein
VARHAVDIARRGGRHPRDRREQAIAVATSASAMPGAPVASVTWVMFARPMNACMIPQTVPNRPT